MLLLQQLVYSYVSTIIDLYQEQKAIGINSHLLLQVDNIKEYLKTLQQRDAQRKKEQFIDKGRDILLDGYIEENFKAIYYKLQVYGTNSLLECYFYMLIDILLGYYILTYSSNRYTTKILDLFTFKFKAKGPIQYIPLIFTTRAGKQNQHGCLKIIRAL